MDDAAAALVRYLENVDDAPEVVYLAAVAMLERAVTEAREFRPSQWRYYPRGQLRRLRRNVAQGLALARVAVNLQEAQNDAGRELDRELREQAAEAGRRRRREQTLPAEEARRENARRRREGGS